MLHVSDIIETMDAWAPPGYAYDWDRSGLATGAPGQKVTSALVCLTVTQEALKAAKKAKADMILSHHPLVWDPLKSLRTDRAVEKLVLDIAASGIACYSAHTNLDIAPGGVNHVLAERLELHDLEPLFPAMQAARVKFVTFVPLTHLERVRNALANAGAGIIGEYSHCSFTSPGTGSFLPSDSATPFVGTPGQFQLEPEQRLEMLVPKATLDQAIRALRGAHPYETPAYDVYPILDSDNAIGLGLRGRLPRAVTLRTFAKKVRTALEISHVRVSGDLKGSVRDIAVMGGAGGGSTSRVPAGIDVFVTGDVKYHEAIDATERGLSVIDAGHHGTEKWIVPAMASYLKSNVKGISVHAYSEPDPFTVITG